MAEHAPASMEIDVAEMPRKGRIRCYLARIPEETRRI